MMIIGYAVYSVIQIAVLIGGIIAWLRSPEPTREELERAELRSSSWPTGYAIALMELHPLHMIEIEFLDEPDRSQRFFRIGTDPSGMVRPLALRPPEN